MGRISPFDLSETEKDMLLFWQQVKCTKAFEGRQTKAELAEATGA